MSNDNEMKVLTKSKCCFCVISVARKVPSTPPVNRSSTFQSLGQATGNTFHRQQTHDGDRSPDVSETISHCFPEYAESSNQEVSHFAACAEEPNNKSRTSQSARRNQRRIRTAQSARKTQTRFRTAWCARTLELQSLGRIYQAGTVQSNRENNTNR